MNEEPNMPINDRDLDEIEALLANACRGRRPSRKRPNKARMRMIPTADPASAGCGPTFHLPVPQPRCCA